MLLLSFLQELLRLLLENNGVKLQNIAFSRGSRVLFENLNLTIPAGEVVAIMGPSGCGKTTLLRLITRDLTPDRGTVWVGGKDLALLKQRELYQLRKQMGFLFQSGALFTGLSVYENVAFLLREHYDLPENIVRKIVLIQLERVGLRGAIDLMPNQLSGGMVRRVALARALVSSPKIMLYDEPLTGQDPINIGVLLKLIREINQIFSLTSVIVSHDVAEVLTIADRVYVLANGGVIASGTPAQIRDGNSALLAQFINGWSDGPMPFHYPTARSYFEDLGIEGYVG